MRIVFFGTPEVSVPTLEMLVDAGHNVVLVITQGDKRRSRGKVVSPSPVKAAAIRLGLPVSHVVNDALTVDADLGVLVAFGRIIKDDVLADLNIVNLHPSLLPRLARRHASGSSHLGWRQPNRNMCYAAPKGNGRRTCLRPLCHHRRN